MGCNRVRGRWSAAQSFPAASVGQRAHAPVVGALLVVAAVAAVDRMLATADDSSADRTMAVAAHSDLR